MKLEVEQDKATGKLGVVAIVKPKEIVELLEIGSDVTLDSNQRAKAVELIKRLHSEKKCDLTVHAVVECFKGEDLLTEFTDACEQAFLLDSAYKDLFSEKLGESVIE